VFQNSFDRVVRAGSPAFHAFAQEPLDLFRREKPERVIARRSGPTVCHETNTVPYLLEGQVALAEVQALSTTDVFRKRVFRGGVPLRMGRMLSLPISPQSPALDGPSSLLGKPASAEGPNTAAKRRGNGEIPLLWSQHRPARNIISERPAELRRCYAISVPPTLKSNG